MSATPVSEHTPDFAHALSCPVCTSALPGPSNYVTHLLVQLCGLYYQYVDYSLQHNYCILYAYALYFKKI